MRRIHLSAKINFLRVRCSMKTVKKKKKCDPEQEFLKSLLVSGLLTEITPRLTKRTRRKERPPVPVVGNAVSDLVFRERR